MGKLEGKIALITGSNSGIGLATAQQCVPEGAYVFITGRRDPELAAVVRAIGNNVAGVQGDVSNLDFMKPVWQARLHAIGRVVTHGRTIGLVACDILDAQEALVARGR